MGFTFEAANKWLGILTNTATTATPTKPYNNELHIGAEAAGRITERRATATTRIPAAASTWLGCRVILTNTNARPALNGACLTANLTSDLITSSVWYLYDGHPLYSTPPTTGIQTGTRTQIRYAGANYSDPRYRDETYTYDAYGNRTSTTVYNSEGTYSTLATANPQVSSSIYETIYHTYAFQKPMP